MSQANVRLAEAGETGKRCASVKNLSLFTHPLPKNQITYQLFTHPLPKNQITYQSKHQHDADADELWEYFQNVIEWVRNIFTNYRREMCNVPWGELYNEFKNKRFDSNKLEKEISALMQDEDVTKKSGIYEYVLTRKEKYLQIRAFTDKMKREAFEKQKGICPHCKGENKNKKWAIEEMEADHIKPWHEGGKTISENCQMLCKEDNRRKSGK